MKGKILEVVPNSSLKFSFVKKMKDLAKRLQHIARINRKEMIFSKIRHLLRTSILINER